jgi:hypothetical protein
MSTMETTAGPGVERLEELPGLAALRRRPLADFANCVGVAIGRASLLVASDAPAVVREVEHYVPLAPWSASSAHWEVVYLHDPALEAAIRRVAEGTGETAYAKRDLHYHSARLGDGTLLLASDDSFGADRHSVVRAGRWVAVVDAAGTEQTRRGPLRVVREVMLRGLENLGGCFGHAAAVDAEGTGCLLVGGNGSGKTSVMWHLVMQGAGYVANDRCVLLREDGRVRVFVYPMSIRLGMGTVGGADALRVQRLQRSQPEGLWAQRVERDDDARANWGNREKLEITPRELSGLTGAGVSLEGTADVLVFPRLEIGAGPVRLRDVSRAAAEAVLRENLREPVDEDFLRGWLGVRRVSDAFLVERQEGVLQALLALPRRGVEGDPRSLQRAAPGLFRELAGASASSASSPASSAREAEGSRAG